MVKYSMGTIFCRPPIIDPRVFYDSLCGQYDLFLSNVRNPSTPLQRRPHSHAGPWGHRAQTVFNSGTKLAWLSNRDAFSSSSSSNETALCSDDLSSCAKYCKPG